MSQPEFFNVKEIHGYTVWVNIAQITSVNFTAPSTALLFVGAEKYVIEGSEYLNKLMDVLTSLEWDAE